MYFRKVGLEIFKYSIAWSVVKTKSPSIRDLELYLMILVFILFLKPREFLEGLRISVVYSQFYSFKGKKYAQRMLNRYSPITI